MTIHVSWDNDAQTALLIHFDREWSWDEFYRMVLNTAELARQVEHKVDLIFDLMDSRPVGSEAVIYCRRWVGQWPANTGHVAIVSRQLMVAAVVSIFGRTNPGCRGNASVTHSLDEARRVLAERRGG